MQIIGGALRVNNIVYILAYILPEHCRPRLGAVFCAIWFGNTMGESFQDCSWIQDFEADFSQKVSLKILNLADSNSFLDLFSVYLKMIDCLNLKLSIFIGILQVLRYDFQKFRILEILNFHPWNTLSVKIQMK